MSSSTTLKSESWHAQCIVIVKMTDQQREHMIDLLQSAYCMEIESVENYLAASVNLDGAKSARLKRLLRDGVEKEFAHAKTVADHIKFSGGLVQGSMQLRKNQKAMQAVDGAVDSRTILQAVIRSEDAAIAHYKLLAEISKDFAPKTHQLAVSILAEEENHRRRFAMISESGEIELTPRDRLNRLRNHHQESAT